MDQLNYRVIVPPKEIEKSANISNDHDIVIYPTKVKG